MAGPCAGVGEHRLGRQFELDLDVFTQDAFEHLRGVGDGFA